MYVHVCYVYMYVSKHNNCNSQLDELNVMSKQICLAIRRMQGENSLSLCMLPLLLGICKSLYDT